MGLDIRDCCAEACRVVGPCASAAILGAGTVMSVVAAVEEKDPGVRAGLAIAGTIFAIATIFLVYVTRKACRNPDASCEDILDVSCWQFTKKRDDGMERDRLLGEKV